MDRQAIDKTCWFPLATEELRLDPMQTPSEPRWPFFPFWMIVAVTLIGMTALVISGLGWESPVEVFKAILLPLVFLASMGMAMFVLFEGLSGIVAWLEKKLSRLAQRTREAVVCSSIRDGESHAPGTSGTTPRTWQREASEDISSEKGTEEPSSLTVRRAPPPLRVRRAA